MSMRVQSGGEDEIGKRDEVEEENESKEHTISIDGEKRRRRKGKEKWERRKVFRCDAFSPHSRSPSSVGDFFLLPSFPEGEHGLVASRRSSRALMGSVLLSRRRRERLGGRRRGAAAAAIFFLETLCAAAAIGWHLDLLSLFLFCPYCAPYRVPRRRRPAPRPRLPRPGVSLGGRSDEPAAARAGQRPSERQGALEGEGLIFFVVKFFFFFSCFDDGGEKCPFQNSTLASLSLSPPLSLKKKKNSPSTRSAGGPRTRKKPTHPPGASATRGASATPRPWARPGSQSRTCSRRATAALSAPRLSPPPHPREAGSSARAGRTGGSGCGI